MLRNFDLVVPLRAGGIAHFWQDNGGFGNDPKGLNETRPGWNGPTVFGHRAFVNS